MIHVDSLRYCNGLVDFGYKKHFRVYRAKSEFARGNTHINGIESFLGCAKTRLHKFRVINKNMLKLHLQEREFIFNNRDDNL